MKTKVEKNLDLLTITKRKCKKLYLEGEIGLSDALRCLILKHELEHKQALRYLGL